MQNRYVIRVRLQSLSASDAFTQISYIDLKIKVNPA